MFTRTAPRNNSTQQSSMLQVSMAKQ